MKPKDDLFALIKSLQKGERRFFKLLSDLHSGDKAYLKLFDAIDQLNVYDEVEVKKRLKGEKSAQHLAVAKNYLHQQLLRSLRIYYDNSSVDTLLHNNLLSIEILFNKGLYAQCDNLLKKTKRLATESQRLNFLAFIYDWEYKLKAVFDYANKSTEYLERTVKEEADLYDKLSLLLQLKELSSRVFLLFKKIGAARTPDEVIRYKTLLDFSVLDKAKDSEYLFCNYFYHNIYGMYYVAVGELEKAYQHRKKNLEIIEESNWRGYSDFKVYSSALNNLLILEKNLGKSSFDKHLEKFKRLPEKVPIPSLKALIFIDSAGLELDKYLLYGEFEDAVEAIEQVQKGIKQHRNYISKEKEYIFYYQFFYAYFGVGDFSKALIWLNKLLDQKEQLREDILAMARIANLTLHYELGNHELLHYLILSANRFLKKSKRLLPLENHILVFFKKLAKDSSSTHMKDLFKSLWEKLSEMDDDASRQILREFDFISWVESKYEDKLFAEVVRKNLSFA